MSATWEADTTPLDGGRVEQVRIRGPAGPLRWGEVIAQWRARPAFMDWFSELLARAPYEAFFWETPPLIRARLGDTFECVVVDSPILAGVRPDPGAFARQFDSAGDVAAFENLGGDAYLIAPRPGGPDQDFAHLAAFVRCATRAQKHALWPALALALQGRLSDRPLWCSTSGLGVFWLHIRLDSRPKYYAFDRYRHGGV